MFPDSISRMKEEELTLVLLNILQKCSLKSYKNWDWVKLYTAAIHWAVFMQHISSKGTPSMFKDTSMLQVLSTHGTLAYWHFSTALLFNGN